MFPLTSAKYSFLTNPIGKQFYLLINLARRLSVSFAQFLKRGFEQRVVGKSGCHDTKSEIPKTTYEAF